MVVAPSPPINLAHLDALSRRIVVAGAPMLATYIYADSPDYVPIGDPDEGIACVDDVARAAVVYLDEHARTGSAHALDQARGALEFTLHMAEPDGRFNNFITDERGTINRTGPTSKPSLGWWSFRGMWALAHGYAAMRDTDAAFAARLLGAYERTETALVDALAAQPGTITSRGRAVPAWLHRFPPDAASVAAIALADMQTARPNSRTAAALEAVADGIASVRVRAGSGGVLDHAGHTPENPELWHAWGAHEAEALARAGSLLGRPDLLDAARVEVEGLAAWQLAAGRIHELGPSPRREGQQAYGVAVAVRGAMALHRATGNERYAKLAGLHASWFAGNNMARTAMYDPVTGRGYDGIDGPPRGVNRSSGAESTIEALMALQAIAGIPAAERFARLTPTTDPRTWTGVQADELRLEGPGAELDARPTSSAVDSSWVSLASLPPGSRATVDVDVDAGNTGDHVLFAGRMRSEPGSSATTLTVSLDGTRVALLTPQDSVDGPHVALDRASGSPFRLGPGRHQLLIEASGEPGATPALLDGLVLHPVEASTRLADGDLRVDLSWRPDDRVLQIDERIVHRSTNQDAGASTSRGTGAR